MNKKNIGMMGGILFILWFIGSIIAMCYFGKTGRNSLMLVVVGQYFFVFGMTGVATMKEKLKWNLLLLLFPIVGLGLITAGLLLHYNVNIGNQPPSWACILMGTNLFTAAGILLLIQQYIIAGELKRCTTTVKATVINMLSRVTEVNDQMRVLYCLEYEIYVNGKKYEVSDHKYEKHPGVEEGDVCEIQINPENPDSGIFIDSRTSGSNWFLLIVGILLVLAGILATYLFV